MAQPNPDEAQFTFYDVAAYWSEEEWKLSNEWQKELCKNTMKEIHRAIIALGYQILNPEVLLRLYKGGDTYIRDPHPPWRRPDTNYLNTTATPDILLRIKHVEDSFCREPHILQETGIPDVSSIGSGSLDLNIVLKNEKPLSDCLRDHQDVDSGELESTFLNSNILKTNEESADFLMNRQCVKEEEMSIADQNTGSSSIDTNSAMKNEQSSSCSMDLSIVKEENISSLDSNLGSTNSTDESQTDPAGSVSPQQATQTRKVDCAVLVNEEQQTYCLLTERSFSNTCILSQDSQLMFQQPETSTDLQRLPFGGKTNYSYDNELMHVNLSELKNEQMPVYELEPQLMLQQLTETRNTRVSNITNEDMADIFSERDADKTKVVIKTSLSIFIDYLKQKGLALHALEQFTAEKLNDLLSDYYAAVRKPNGDSYAKSTLITLRYGLQKYFIRKTKMNIMKDDSFLQANTVFAGVLKKLKQEGKGSPKHKEAIPKQDLHKLYQKMDINTPKGLQHKVFIDLMLHLCNRSRESLGTFRKEDFIIEIDAKQRKYVTTKSMKATSKNRQDAECEDDNQPRMYQLAHNSTCPVTSFEKYISKLHPDCPSFWQRSKPVAPEEGPWFSPYPLGKNAFATLMRDISIIYKLSKQFTNHCLRATHLTPLDEQFFSSNTITIPNATNSNATTSTCS